VSYFGCSLVSTVLTISVSLHTRGGVYSLTTQQTSLSHPRGGRHFRTTQQTSSSDVLQFLFQCLWVLVRSSRRWSLWLLDHWSKRLWWDLWYNRLYYGWIIVQAFLKLFSIGSSFQQYLPFSVLRSVKLFSRKTDYIRQVGFTDYVKVWKST